MGLHRAWLAVVGAASAVRADPCAPILRGTALNAAWQRAFDALNDELATRADIEPCVAVSVRGDRSGRATLVVRLGERSATRVVADPASLRATVLALVIEPMAPPDDAVQRAVPVEAPTESVTITAPDEPRFVARAIRHETSAAPGLDIGLAMGAQWTGHAAHASVAATLRESRGSWSLGVYGRLVLAPSSTGSSSTAASGATMDTSSPSASPDGVSARELGAELGRRFDLGRIALTASAGPSVVWLRQLAPAGTRSASVVRAGGEVRVDTGWMRHFGLFVAADAGCNLGDLQAANRGTPDAPLPGWSAGASIGGELRAWP